MLSPYATFADEIAHWARHPFRLNRDFGGKRFGNEGYAVEELVAELGTAKSRPSGPGDFHPESLTDSGLDTLASSGSCHRLKAAAFH
jgi:Zincin-like metallopeptidase